MLRYAAFGLMRYRNQFRRRSSWSRSSGPTVIVRLGVQRGDGVRRELRAACRRRPGWRCTRPSAAAPPCREAPRRRAASEASGSAAPAGRRRDDLDAVDDDGRLRRRRRRAGAARGGCGPSRRARAPRGGCDGVRAHGALRRARATRRRAGMADAVGAAAQQPVRCTRAAERPHAMARRTAADARRRLRRTAVRREDGRACVASAGRGAGRGRVPASRRVAAAARLRGECSSGCRAARQRRGRTSWSGRGRLAAMARQRGTGCCGARPTAAGAAWPVVRRGAGSAAVRGARAARRRAPRHRAAAQPPARDSAPPAPRRSWRGRRRAARRAGRARRASSALRDQCRRASGAPLVGQRLDLCQRPVVGAREQVDLQLEPRAASRTAARARAAATSTATAPLRRIRRRRARAGRDERVVDELEVVRPCGAREGAPTTQRRSSSARCGVGLVVRQPEQIAVRRLAQAAAAVAQARALRGAASGTRRRRTVRQLSVPQTGSLATSTSRPSTRGAARAAAGRRRRG